MGNSASRLITALTFMCFTVITNAQVKVYSLDAASVNDTPPKPLTMKGRSSSGTVLSVNSRYFEMNGKPWYPLMGEFHYIRFPAEYWEEQIQKMKAAGLDIVATSVFWNAHENPKGTWNWTGIRDLRKFIQLCGKHGMYVWLRIGPWSNGDQLNGGHPDWIDKMKGKRTNDPLYLRASNILFSQIGKQLEGLFFKDGGPIIGIQLENGFASGDINHIDSLKQLAQTNNINPVFFSVTANTVFNDVKGEVIPLQGAYPYRASEQAGGGLTKDFLYGNDLPFMTDTPAKVYYDANKYPKGLSEQGSGSQMTYRNRFVVEPHVLEAHLHNQIGRGMNMVGYYMFQGGTQLAGSREVSLPKTYDSQAPLTEFGFVQPSYRYLKLLHIFLRDFGADLAPMTVVEPANPVRDPNDTANLRYIARISGSSGFLFMGNTQVRIQMPDKAFRLRLTLKDEVIEFPRGELNFKGQTTAILPFNLALNGALLKYATAQPLSRINNKNKQVLFLTEVEGMNVELAFDANTIRTISANGWNTSKSDGKIFLTPEKGGMINILSADGRQLVVVLLTREQAENCWRFNIRGREFIAISGSDLVVDRNGVQMTQFNDPSFSIDIYPHINTSQQLKIGKSINEIFSRYEWQVPEASPQVRINRHSPQEVTLEIDEEFPSTLSDVAVEVEYVGGSAELLIDDSLATDHLFHGPNWKFGLKRFRKLAGGEKLRLKILPWSNDIRGIPEKFLEQVRHNPAHIRNIEFIPQYQSTIVFE